MMDVKQGSALFIAWRSKDQEGCCVADEPTSVQTLPWFSAAAQTQYRIFCYCPNALQRQGYKLAYMAEGLVPTHTMRLARWLIQQKNAEHRTFDTWMNMSMSWDTVWTANTFMCESNHVSGGGGPAACGLFLARAPRQITEACCWPTAVQKDWINHALKLGRTTLHHGWGEVLSQSRIWNDCWLCSEIYRAVLTYFFHVQHQLIATNRML